MSDSWHKPETDGLPLIIEVLLLFSIILTSNQGQQPRRLFGFTHQTGFCMASPEKAILDTLYYRKTIPAQDELELDAVDLDLLKKWADTYPSSLSRSLAHFNALTIY